MNIAAILPCRGRAEQTIANVKRLLATAGMEHASNWQLYCVVAGDDSLAMRLSQLCIVQQSRFTNRLTYWQALAYATERTDATHLVNLANDLLPGMHWLRKAVRDYQSMFGDGPGLLGFNGDSHEVEHSCHFLISRGLLDRYGGWPIWFDHNFGDAELCQRATEDGLYAKSIWALLFHDHPYWGGQDDNVYEEGRRTIPRDQALYEQRRRAGWPTVRSASDAQLTPATSGVGYVDSRLG